ncbi:Uncharacterised protein [Mycobacteroides abscessus subsp. abscessus]|uniref:hypothetical protein n=1 Tax=Mycobacteroides abscessus TaxID=36809 RepID=UPI000925F9BC|nr:hypothetical protein [Mycobacteroides abscessus]MDM2175305.1 hypothetical protein [Mycobacteroides abscessus]MDM2176309.1 hypothetical protein [Mycobacteroides abscessus]MDM2204874.1 hypothetical protein [Mycobacteroides abscessus]MDM2210459.1 hypothetical protein [Mycobacteroides abscessus]MDM2215793.1 hypothetical protein [Mycobacteroides abscessus]
MAYLTKPQRAERAYVLRELLLRPALRRRENPTPDYLSAVDDLTDEMVVTDNGGVLSVSTTDMLGRSDDTRHNTVAAARLIMAHLETATGRASTTAHLGAGLAHRGFTPATINAALTWLTEQSLITVTNGIITDITGDRRPSSPRPALPAELLAPRNTAPALSPSTPANTRPRMDAGGLIEHPDKLDMGKKLRAQARAMPSASFEVGDVPAAPSVKKDAAAQVIPDSVLVAYIDAITSAFARNGKPSAAWRELGVKLPPTAPEGVTRQEVAAAALDKLAEGGTIRHESGVYTHIPAERAVAGLTEWLGESKAGVLITPAAVAALARREDVQRLTPNGWNAETLVALALDAVVISGELKKVDGGWMKPAPAPAPKPAPEAVETAPEAPAPAPKPNIEPAGDTTSTKPKTEGNKSTKPDTETHAPVDAGALEKKVDTLTTEVRAIGARLHTLPAPPTAERVLLDEADADVKMLLESVCVRLKLDGPQRDSPLHRVLPGKAKPTRSNPDPIDRRLRLGEALTLGVDAKILAHDPLTRTYRLITATPLMSKAALERRVQRIKDMRDAAKEKDKKKDKKDAA